MKRGMKVKNKNIKKRKNYQPLRYTDSKFLLTYIENVSAEVGVELK